MSKSEQARARVNGPYDVFCSNCGYVTGVQKESTAKAMVTYHEETDPCTTHEHTVECHYEEVER